MVPGVGVVYVLGEDHPVELPFRIVDSILFPLELRYEDSFVVKLPSAAIVHSRNT